MQGHCLSNDINQRIIYWHLWQNGLENWLWPWV